MLADTAKDPGEGLNDAVFALRTTCASATAPPAKLTGMLSDHDREDTPSLVIRARCSAGPLTLTAIGDAPGHVAHVDVDDAGIFLDREQAQQLADALPICCEPSDHPGTALALHGLVLHARFGTGPLTLTALSDVHGQVAHLEVAVGRDGDGKRSSDTYLSAQQAEQAAAWLQALLR